MMKKSNIVTVGLASAMVMTVGSQTVKADEVKEVSTNDAVEQVNKEIVQADVNSSKTAYDKAQSEVEKQEGLVSEKKAELDNKTREKQEAQVNYEIAEKMVAEATPENIKKTEAEMTDIESDIKAKEADVKQKGSVVKKAESKVGEQEKHVESAEQSVKEAESEVKGSQEDVNRAKAVLDGTGAEAIIATAEKTQLAEEEKQTKVNQAMESLDKAKEADSKRQSEIDLAKKVLSEKEATFKVADEVLKEATKKAEKTSKDLADKTVLYEATKTDFESLPIFTVPESYARYLKQFVESEAGSTAYNEAKQKLKELYAEAVKVNRFKSNANDKKVLIETNNLTNHQRKELSLYVNEVVNQVRKAFGTELTHVSEGAIWLADLVTDGYVNDGWSWNKFTSVGHDNKAINTSANRLGLETSETGQYYENLSYHRGIVKSMTMDDAKKRIYTAINDFIFSDQEWLHATSVAGLGWNKGQREYIAVDLSALSDITNVHLLLVPEKNIKTTAFNKVVPTNPNSIENVTARYERVKRDYEDLKEADKKAKEEWKGASDTQKTANQEMLKAKENLNVKEAVEVLTAKAEKVLEESKKELELAKLENAKAQQAVKDLNADIQVKRALYEKAKAVLAEAEGNLKEEQGVLAAEKMRLVQLENELKVAQDSLAEAEKDLATSKTNLSNKKSYLDLLLHAPENLEEAKKVYQLAEEKLKKAEAEYFVEEEKLQELRIVRDEKKKAYEKTLLDYQLQETKKIEMELEQKRQELEKQGYLVLPVFDELGNIVDYTYKEKPKSTSKEFPKTGTSNSVFASIGFILLGMLGGFKKKKQVN